MRRTLAALASVVALAGCGTAKPPAATAPAAPTATPLAKPTSVCGAFSTFTAKMYQLTPKDQIALVPYAQAVQQAAQTRLPSLPQSEYSAVINFVAWVGSSRFSYYGNVFSKPYTRMQRYCP